MLNVEIISIEGFLFQGQAHQVVVPVVSGDIGFMKGHESLVGELKEGNISVFDDADKVIKEIAVKSGTVEMFDGKKLVVLVDA